MWLDQLEESADGRPREPLARGPTDRPARNRHTAIANTLTELKLQVCACYLNKVKRLGLVFSKSLAGAGGAGRAPQATYSGPPIHRGAEAPRENHPRLLTDASERE
jgi:hypothetical protein